MVAATKKENVTASATSKIQKNIAPIVKNIDRGTSNLICILGHQPFHALCLSKHKDITHDLVLMGYIKRIDIIFETMPYTLRCQTKILRSIMMRFFVFHLIFC